MKKVLLFLVCVFTVHISSAQLNDIYLSNDVVLSDNQWHFDDYSVIEATGNNYLVITPNQYYYYYLPAFNVFDFEIRYGDRVCSYKPYVYRNNLGWYVNGAYHNYFYYPANGYCVMLSYVPVFYDFYYQFKRHRHIDLRCWHWRPHGHYHHLWKPPHRPHHHYDKPHHPHNGYDKPRPPKHDGYSRPHNNPPKNGNVRPPSRPSQSPNVSKPHRGNMYSRPSTSPSRNSNVTRPSVPHSRGSATIRQAPPSRSSSHSRSSSSRSSSSNQRRR